MSDRVNEIEEAVVVIDDWLRFLRLQAKSPAGEKAPLTAGQAITLLLDCRNALLTASTPAALKARLAEINERNYPW